MSCLTVALGVPRLCPLPGALVTRQTRSHAILQRPLDRHDSTIHPTHPSASLLHAINCWAQCSPSAHAQPTRSVLRPHLARARLRSRPVRPSSHAPRAHLVTPRVQLVTLVRPPGRNSARALPSRAHVTCPRGRQVQTLAPRAEDSASIATSPIRPISVDCPCRIQTTFPLMTDRARAAQVRHASPPFRLKLFYLFQYFPHLLLPSSGHSLGRVIR